MTPKDKPAPVDVPADVPAPAEDSPGTRRTAGGPVDENARLRERIAQLEDKLRERGEDPGPSVPVRPSFGLSEGERSDLAEHGVTSSAFTGERLTASGEGVEPANERAAAADRRATQAQASTR
jgi:hypothetical protein